MKQTQKEEEVNQRMEMIVENHSTVLLEIYGLLDGMMRDIQGVIFCLFEMKSKKDKQSWNSWLEQTQP